MSCYIVDEKTISAIVKGFEEYNVSFNAEGYRKPGASNSGWRKDLSNQRKTTGQSLLDQNIKSCNYRFFSYICIRFQY